MCVWTEAAVLEERKKGSEPHMPLTRQQSRLDETGACGNRGLLPGCRRGWLPLSGARLWPQREPSKGQKTIFIYFSLLLKPKENFSVNKYRKKNIKEKLDLHGKSTFRSSECFQYLFTYWDLTQLKFRVLFCFVFFFLHLLFDFAECVLITTWPVVK